MGLVVTVPTAEGLRVSVLEEQVEAHRFYMAIAKTHIGFSGMA
jgi:hypothetical protein